MILPFFVMLAIVSVPLAGGRLGRLADLRVRAVWTVVAAMALQVVIIEVVQRAIPQAVASALHLVSYALAVWFVIANRRIRGLWIVALGGALNLVAITLNHGVMPASPEAARTAGIVKSADQFDNSAPTPGARVWFLGDVFAVPKRYPMANVFSGGDVILVIGFGVVLHAACDSRLSARRRATVAAESVHQSPN